ncbi:MULTISPECIES: sigma-70 family RNA polymerase sigma factor [unclassified Mesorhizobium]|uniref:sigma-70 family RNA polymerase sigma factor n=1 Tax=unclassified Mesorhizobium TaxID=325217 RepID=UPI000FCB05E4|nr:MULTISPECIES: sigma-70 family RNA polymerase sigma factor [unclassified Mesorhizobium]TGP20028.1 sigma-70 family RNA polymerase sigma factor [Mesorhizobium sp. M1D.F.Ca.ET.231.01.1.1]TGP27400.1 sigma-70 family RNA polymerase sigma factor [Mesorhizobium sp. M1D.F.Ca.ET.234.01.1.1]TGS41435.1 sigma-70 family RNA polymerase sigma factor [Mesorhizobium sp. M1D.F.Ca.ET.184.01.1.1]TGS59196.1 sigma-70 family RNA polymerase sigma factor [Mesorhizobium sp. M1D.F.Ca.ET.183.01.1.1]
MTIQPRFEPTGLFDIRYAAFLETVAHLRQRLHRYCSRMTGSALDGEDVMQETLFEIYRKIEMIDDPGALRSWLFRTAHNRCIDFLRNQQTRRRAEANFAVDEIVLPVEPAGQGADRAIERLVIHLPPKERACILLKDVFDHSLEEIADLVGSTVGGVKAALSRGRAKLAALPEQPAVRQEPSPDPELSKLLNRYIELFNRRDWDGVRALTSADAQLRVSDCFRGHLSESIYFVEYEKGKANWQMTIGTVDDEIVLLVVHRDEAGWKPAYPVRIEATNGIINRISDYYACPWLLRAARTVVVASPN